MHLGPGSGVQGAGLLVLTHQRSQGEFTLVTAPLKAPHLGLLGGTAATCSHPQSSLPAGETRAAAAHSAFGKMSACGRKALTLLSSVFAVCGLGLLGIAVSTDYWLYLEEGVVLPQNQSTEIKMSLHSGLWRVCFLAGKGTQGCGQLCPERGAAPPPGKPAQARPSPTLGKRCRSWKETVHQTTLLKPQQWPLQQPGPIPNSSLILFEQRSHRGPGSPHLKGVCDHTFPTLPLQAGGG